MRGVIEDKPGIIVIDFGSMDRWSYRPPDGGRYVVGTAPWRKVYVERVDALIRDLKGAGAAIYWVGLPIMRRNDSNEAAQILNEVFRERAYLGGVRFIDVYQGFADEDGAYSSYGPDLAGKNRLLRDSDGMHMTDAGYQKLAHFVERAIKPDLARAQNMRAVPLAGSESEQALIKPERSVRSGSDAPGGWAGATQFGRQGPAGAGEQGAQTSRINLKTVTSSGQEQVLTIDILRPEIPAAVLALVTKSESPDKPSQMGDQMVDQIPGGLTVMSSITPAVDTGTADRPKLSTAQTPYFRVLVKGERLAVRAGRADDVSWPLPKAPPLEQRQSRVIPDADTGSVPVPAANPSR
ncbi:MAG: GDSL-type esterase/lipase family protein [Hyphomicrobiaceae bacterium]